MLTTISQHSIFKIQPVGGTRESCTASVTTAVGPLALLFPIHPKKSHHESIENLSHWTDRRLF